MTSSTSDAGYAEAIAALRARGPDRMVAGLDRMDRLVDLLGDPQAAYSAVAITGTNGKTSTAAMVTSLLRALRLVAGSYTSPHLQDVRERIRVSGELIGPEALEWHLRYLGPFLDEVDAVSAERTTYFEVLTAAALLHFADAPVDLAVLEVGMGGRSDATNVVDAEVAVVLPVALDHRELGATAAEVATEKAGIVKDGAITVSAAQPEEVLRVLVDEADRHESRLVVAERDFGVLERRPAVGGQELVLRGVTGTIEEIYIPLLGAHQATNAACALAAVEAVLGFERALDPDVVREGFAGAASPGRLEVVRRDDHATVVLDGAHNVAGAEALARSLRDDLAFRHRIAVVGVLGDKDVEGIVGTIARAVDHVVACAPTSGRAAPADRVARAAEAAGASVEVAGGVEEALDRAEGLAGDEDGVVVTGSLATVGAARDALGLPPA